MAPPLHKRLKRAVRSALVRAAIGLVAVLPLRAAVALGGLGGRLGWLLARQSRALALRHLALAFPERTEAERRAIARGCFLHLGRMAGEVIAIRSYDARLEEHVVFSAGSEELLRARLAGGRGVVFVTGHVGSWELMARRVARAGIPNAVIAKRGADPRLNALAERFRASGGVTTLWREDPATGRAILRTFKDGKALGLLIDQDTKVQGLFAPFFGRPAHTPRAAADLALRFAAPVVVATTRRRGPDPCGGHVVDLVEIPFDPAAPDREAEAVRLTAACNAVLESAIRRNPTEWVWMHRRWKTEPPSTGSLASAVPKSRELSST
ncbi:MAG TPA: lysophospholipid acyltransferase family protein [Anaeromyxobacteraceae bacterium]|nr:lysophospholipid acyltransferase family protein [Anaeromyxobacteraceae bacterium]